MKNVIKQVLYNNYVNVDTVERVILDGQGVEDCLLTTSSYELSMRIR